MTNRDYSDYYATTTTMITKTTMTPMTTSQDY